MKFAFCLVLLCAYTAGYAQQDFTDDTVVGTVTPDEERSHGIVDPDALETTKAYLSSPVTIRRFDEERWKNIVGGVDYEEETLEVEDKKSYSPLGGSVLRIISFVVIGALFIALIYYLTRYISVDVKIERTSLHTGDLARPVENIAELDIEQLLEQAKRDGNYKLGVRLYYLGLLKKLNDRGAIVWKKDKTNRDYLSELFSANVFFDEVKKLTRSYEVVWYGDHDLMPDTFVSVAAQFESIYARLNKKEST